MISAYLSFGLLAVLYCRQDAACEYVKQQFGKKIIQVIRDTLEEIGVTDAYVEAVDKGALDCAVRARTAAAAFRAADNTDYGWRVKS
jgi:citrate lyase acyl carrier protein